MELDPSANVSSLVKPARAEISEILLCVSSKVIKFLANVRTLRSWIPASLATSSVNVSIFSEVIVAPCVLPSVFSIAARRLRSEMLIKCISPLLSFVVTANAFASRSESTTSVNQIVGFLDTTTSNVTMARIPLSAPASVPTAAIETLPSETCGGTKKASADG